MNIFIVHSGADIESVNKIKDTLCKNKYARILVLNNGPALWKKEAKQLIKKAQLVFFVVGENSHKSDNIKWELKKAKQYNKMLMFYKLSEEFILPEELKEKDNFLKEKVLKATEINDIQDLIKKIDSYEKGEYSLFNQKFEEMNSSQLLEQYKIFLQTSETLVARRQSVNSFYITVNAAIVTISSIAVSISTEWFVKCMVVAILAGIGLILDYSWKNVLDAYGTLNGSKMKVISLIEKQLPISLFDTEWAVMSDKLNSKKYVSFTDSEKRIPMIFFIIHSIIVISCIIWLLVNLF